MGAVAKETLGSCGGLQTSGKPEVETEQNQVQTTITLGVALADGQPDALTDTGVDAERPSLL
jgi:hypothetical protein